MPKSTILNIFKSKQENYKKAKLYAVNNYPNIYLNTDELS